MPLSRAPLRRQWAIFGLSTFVPTERTLSHYIEGIQQVESLMMTELWALKPMLEFAILEQIAGYGAAVLRSRWN